MLAFLDSPIQLMVVMLVVLVVFGPDKLPEIGKKLGKAMRELMHARQEFMDNFTKLDDDDDRRYNRYDPPNYDNYNSSYSSYETYSSENSSSDYKSDYSGSSSYPPGDWRAAAAPEETRRGDFVSSALAETEGSYNYTPTPTARPAVNNGANGNNGHGRTTPDNAVPHTEANSTPD